MRPDVMSDPQKQVYDRIFAGTVPWATNAGFRVKAEGGGLLGPYNSQLLSPGTDAGYLDMLDPEKKHTTLSVRFADQSDFGRGSGHGELLACTDEGPDLVGRGIKNVRPRAGA